MIDHDRLFKELISTFFVEFIELFFPQLRTYLDTQSITFLDKEIFTDVTEGEKHESDLIAQVKFAGKSSYFLIHVEAQASAKANFNRRMFTYFARFHENFSLPVYQNHPQPAGGAGRTVARRAVPAADRGRNRPGTV